MRKLKDGQVSKFTFNKTATLERAEMDIGCDDVLQNIVPSENLHMNGNVPWRGPWEKFELFMQMLVLATTQPGDIVMDCIVSTCSIFPYT